MKKIIIGLIAVGVIIGVRTGYQFMKVSGAFDSMQEKLTAECRKIEIFPGAEDITIDHENGIVFVSAMDRRAIANGKVPERGNIFAFSVGNASDVRAVSLDGPTDFQPHGIGLYKGDEGNRLFVVSHPNAGGHTIEIFDIGAEGILTHSETVRQAVIHHPNDVIPVGPRHFYATNDYAENEKSLVTGIQNMLLLANTDAIFYDGTNARIVTPSLNRANGINVSMDGRTVYIAEIVGRRIAVFDRDPETNDLSLIKHIPLNTSPDNLEFGEDGLLYTGGHTRILDYLKHAEDESFPAPSHVVRTNPDTGETEDILMNIDGTYTASTVAATANGRMYVGSVFESSILDCPLKN